jgi:hypothetical protein
MINITFFNGKGKYKVPRSPYDKENKNKFIFITKEISLKDLYKANKENFILTSSFNIDNLLLGRNAYSLNPHLTDEFNFLIMDFDKIESKFDMVNIINILKEKDYTFSLYKSRSHNDKTVFNMKGAIKFNGKNNTNSRNKAYEYLHTLVGDYCKVDFSISSVTSYQAPSYKSDLLIYNEGKNIEEFYFEDEIKYKKVELCTNISLEKDVYDLCISIFFEKGFSISKETSDMINMRHPKEKTPGGYFMFKDNPTFLNHFNKEKSFSIYNEVKSNPIYKKFIQHKIELIIKDNIFIKTKSKKINSRYINTKDFIDELEMIKNGENCALLIKSAMGTGKTSVITEVKKDKRLLLLTNRKTLAYEYKDKFPEMKLYCEDKYEVGDSLICQYDSIHKYNLQYFDVFILDEFMSLTLHSLNALGDESNFNKLKLFYILNKLKTPLIIMDAFLTGVEKIFINRENVQKIENTYKDKIKTIYHTSDNSQISMLISKLKEKEKISFSCTNKMYGRIVKKIVENYGFKVQMIDSDTTDENRERIFKLLKEETHNEWDLLIYTPTITVGINILNKSKYHFHYSDGTTDIISSIQQTKRNRKSEEIHLLLKNKRFQNVINFEEINSMSREKLKEHNVTDGLYVNFDEWGNYGLSEFGEFNNKIIFLDNILKTNHNFIFKSLMEEQFSNKLISEVEFKNYDFDISKIRSIINEEDKELYINEINSLFEMNDFDFEIHKTSNKNFKIIEDNFSMNKNEIKEVLEYIIKDKKYVQKIKMLKLFFDDSIRLKNMIKFGLSENFKSSYIINLELISKFKGISLKERYEEKDLRNEKFRKFLRLIGYKRSGKNYKLGDIYKKNLSKLIF